MVKKAKDMTRDELGISPPIVVEMQTDSTSHIEDATAVINRTMNNLKQVTQTAVPYPPKLSKNQPDN